MAYSIIYSPDIEPFESSVNFVCSDHKVHFRFRDFQKFEHIQGFEKKLIYLMEYLFNYCYIPSLTANTPFIKEQLLENFLKSSSVLEVSKTISDFVTDIKFKGLKAYLNYNKKVVTKPFGNIKDSYFPIVGNNSLIDFQKKMQVDLLNYLFNDRYSIILHDGFKKNINQKFKNKLTKTARDSDDENLVKLW